MNMETSALACLGNIFLDPKKAMSDIRGHNVWLWYPLVITLAMTVGFLIWYYLTVDFGWLVDQILSARSASMNAEQMDAARRSMTRGNFLIFGVLGTAVALIALYALQALYYFLVAKVIGYETQGYADWFSFTIWTGFPSVLGYVAAAIAYLFTTGRQVNPYAADVTSLNTLLFHLHMDHPWFTLVNSVHLTTFWVLALMVYGLSQWTRRSLGHAAVVVLTPYVAIYGLWILIKLV